MEKYGFVYIWYDRKRKMYYIGCHWGYEWDSYICSSTRMRNTYNRRPEDFRRRVIKSNITSRLETLEEEFRWLSMIPSDQLGRKYYNHSKKHFGHWSAMPNADAIREKAGSKNKGRKHNFSEEYLKDRGRKISVSKQNAKEKKLALGLPVRQPEKVARQPIGPHTEESNLKRSQTLKEGYKSGRLKGNTGKTIVWSDERKENHKLSHKDAHKNHKLHSESYSEGNKKAWASGKFANRKSNNIRDYIWVHTKDTKKNTRIKKEDFNPDIHNHGQAPKI